MNGPQISWLPDGRRLHMNHGPIDLVVEAWGEAREVRLAYEQAAARFETVLTELVAELAGLRRAIGTSTLESSADGGLEKLPPPRTPPRKGEGGTEMATPPSPLRGGVRGGGEQSTSGAVSATFTHPTARRMAAAVSPLSDRFITPMAAVAGAVADEMLAAMLVGRSLTKAYVNDGGDIAVYLAQGEELTLAVAGAGNGFGDRLTIGHDDPARGVATSGWRGRSFSLGIADAVTALAKNGAAADAAATIIANDVDLPGHPAIGRAPASSLQPDSDLGGRLVTTGVGALSRDEIAQALDNGVITAHELLAHGLICGAALFLAGETRVVGACQSPTLIGNAPGHLQQSMPNHIESPSNA